MVATLLPTMLVIARTWAMNQSTPRINNMPSTGIVCIEERVAVKVMNALPTTAAAPFEVTKQTSNTANSCPKLKWIFSACAMKSAPMVR